MTVESVKERAAYRCYGFEMPTGAWRPWVFAPATVETVKSALSEAHRRSSTLFLSTQLFEPPEGVEGHAPWPEVSGQYRGPNALCHYAPLYFDIDADDLDRARDLCRPLVIWLTEELRLPEPDVRVYSSGSKGFHVIVNPRALGIVPASDLTACMKQIAVPLADRIGQYTAGGLGTDPAAYSLPRLLRVPGGWHRKSGLYKVELYHRELYYSDMSAIREIAQKPRPSLWDGSEFSRSIIPDAAAWWRKELAQVREEKGVRRLTAESTGAKVGPDGYTLDELLSSDMPPCISSLMAHGLPKGARNRGELQLACWAKAAGLAYEDGLRLERGWTRRNRPEMPEAVADHHAASVVKAVYAGAYGFSCAAMLATGIRVECDGCKVVKARPLKNMASLRLGVDQNWEAPNRMSLDTARQFISQQISGFIGGAR